MRVKIARRALTGAAVGAAALMGVAPAPAQPVPGSACTLFPADNAWHADVRNLPVHARSAQWLAAMGGTGRRLHPDFGPNGADQPYGIPYAVVGSEQARVTVSFDYDDESDHVAYPFGPQIPVEDGGDAHALIVDKDACKLYELYAVDWNGGHPTAGSGAVWDLRSNALRPDTWTSADAAGLPILPGLLRRDEVVAGEVDHAIRMTAQSTDRSYLWPARHQAGAAADPSLPPMGARFRLRAGFDLSRFRPDTQVVLRAMQKHGMILADNGSNWFFTGTSEQGWDEDFLDELKSISAGDFEAVDFSSLRAEPDSGRVAGSAPAPVTTVPPAAPPTTKATPTTKAPTATTRPATATTAAATPTTGAPVTQAPVTTVPPAAPPPETTTTLTPHPTAGADSAAPAPDAETARQNRTVPIVFAGAVAGIAGAFLVARRRRTVDRP